MPQEKNIKTEKLGVKSTNPNSELTKRAAQLLQEGIDEQLKKLAEIEKQEQQKKSGRTEKSD